MCGISGILSSSPLPPEELRSRLRSMGLWLHHRGPDAWGEHIEDRIGLGHNRLSIVDLATGNQPMFSRDGNTVVVFNGEIYNYRALWRELEELGNTFQTDHSDTEVIVVGYQQWGLEVFRRLEGMFAVGIWDRLRDRLILARDEMGIKPLYYTHAVNGSVVFASEPKAILKSGDVCPRFRAAGMVEYFLFRAPLQTNTLFEGICKLRAGHYQVFHGSGKSESAVDFRRARNHSPYTSDAEALQEIERSLSNAVVSHLQSDVPVGVFLSGGVDSSLVTALAAKHQKLSAFTIGTDSPLDESEYATTLGQFTGIDVNLRIVDGSDFLNEFQAWMYVNDDPCSDPSALGLMVLSRLARQSGMKVMLSGEGSDEQFGGYNAYVRYLAFSRLRRIPGATWFSRALAWGMQGRNEDYLQNLKQLRFWGTGHLTTHRIRKSLFDASLQPYVDEIREYCQANQNNGNPLRTALDFDQQVRLPDDLLMRTDRASMFHSIEARVPYLDTHVLQTAARLSEDQCIRFGLFKYQTKRLLKQLAEKYIPRELIYRPKRGFDLPIATWLSSNFHQTIQQFLDEAKVPALNYDFLRSLLKTGAIRNASLVWAWMVLEKWYRNWIDLEAEHLCPEPAKAHPAYALLASSGSQRHRK